MMKNNLIILILSLSLFGCSSIYFSPIDWFGSYERVPETSATPAGDCTTDAQCEESMPGENFICYKRHSYVGQCISFVE